MIAFAVFEYSRKTGGGGGNIYPSPSAARVKFIRFPVTCDVVVIFINSNVVLQNRHSTTPTKSCFSLAQLRGKRLLTLVAGVSNLSLRYGKSYRQHLLQTYKPV